MRRQQTDRDQGKVPKDYRLSSSSGSCSVSRRNVQRNGEMSWETAGARGHLDRSIALNGDIRRRRSVGAEISMLGAPNSGDRDRHLLETKDDLETGNGVVES